MTDNKIDMREHITEQANYARACAEDGAYSIAARVLRELADTIQTHANRRDAEMRQAMAEQGFK